MELVCGIGINDAEYVVKPQVNGKRVICPFYKTWHNLLKRVSPSVRKAEDSSYIGTSICEEWKYFSKFKAWMEVQTWDVEGYQLDKDLIKRGNKVYSPEYCAFVPDYVNTALLANKKGQYPLGVTMWNAARAKCFVAQCSSRCSDNNSKYLGYFTDPFEAHKAWQEAKIASLQMVLDEYRKAIGFDSRVEQTFLDTIQKIKFDLNNNLETRSL